MFKHEDARRRLIEWGKGTWKVAKVITAAQDCVVGEHYHRKKDEQFLLLSGRCIQSQVGDDMMMYVTAPREWYVPRGMYHSFALEAGSVLLGLASEEYDPTDEHTD